MFAETFITSLYHDPEKPLTVRVGLTSGGEGEKDLGQSEKFSKEQHFLLSSKEREREEKMLCCWIRVSVCMQQTIYYFIVS